MDAGPRFTVRVSQAWNQIHSALQQKADMKCARKGYDGAELIQWEVISNTYGEGRAVAECQ